MKYLSVCSGIEAASVAWHSIGWEPLAFSEIEPFPRAVLAHHYPDVPCHGDFTKLCDEPWIVDADVLVGGTPCQAFSVAGLRKSLDDDRGNLSLKFVRLADAIDDVRHADGRQPAIIVWENVPGVLSVKDNAFGCFLSGLAGDDTPYVPPRRKWTNAGVVAGPKRTVAWRVLDAQYFGLAQRRRRVFVVASAREGFDPAAVLFEFEGLRRDSPPRREARQDAAADAVSGADERRSHWDGIEHPHPTLNQSFNTGAIGYSNQELFSQRGACLVGEASTGDISHCLNAGGMGRQDYETETLVTHALRGEGFDGMAVRRLTPRECEALQGFPDDYTMIPWRGKPAEDCPDRPRYKALGNSMAVPCMRWIGRRISDHLCGNNLPKPGNNLPRTNSETGNKGERHD